MKKIKSFTLVEMLIVMGIIVILMAVGIASGRFAIRRANKIEHQNSVDRKYEALQSYYSDFREYPGKESGMSVEDLMSEAVLGSYMENSESGSEATYVYKVDPTGQVMIICVTLGGIGDQNHLGIYCKGNGIGSTLIDNGDFTGHPQEQEIEYSDENHYEYNSAVNLFETGDCSDWSSDQEWLGTCTVPDEIIVNILF